MIAAKRVSECALYARLLSPYIDGELDPGHAAEMEAHVVGCALCSERVALARSVRQSLKARATAHAPEAFRARMQALVVSEKLRAERTSGDALAPHPAGANTNAGANGNKMPSMKVIAAFAAAAGVLFAVGLSRNGASINKSDAQAQNNIREEERSQSGGNRVVGLEDLIDDLIALHKHPLPPETTNPDEVPRFEPLVGVPVRRPAVFQLPGSRFNGARIHALREQRAALLQYTVGGSHRVTVYVFDPRVVPMSRAAALQARVIEERPVYVGKRGGYSVAAMERSGIGYALATDLDDNESANLVLAASHP